MQNKNHKPLTDIIMANISNVMVTEWFTELLATHNIVNAENLTKNMILDEIREIKGTIKNEKLWALGAPSEETTDMHLDNIEVLEEYINFLETLLAQNV